MRLTHRFFFILLILCCPKLALAVAAEMDGEQTQLAYFFSLTPPLVANLERHGSYIRCDIDLMAENKMELKVIEQYAPVIRHELLLLLGEQNSSELNTPEGKEALRQKALDMVVAVILAKTGKNSVQDLYFTGFFITK